MSCYDEVYYRLYLSPHDEKICVITMQDHDEYDYDHDRYLREKGTDLVCMFYDEHDAIKYAQEKLKHEFLCDELQPVCSHRAKNDAFYKD